MVFVTSKTTACAVLTRLPIAPRESCLGRLRAPCLHQRYGYQIYDALHLASALENGCSILYTEDLQHGQQIEGLTIRNPFETQRK